MMIVMRRPSFRLASLWLVVALLSLALAACEEITAASKKQGTNPAPANGSQGTGTGNPAEPDRTPVDEFDAALMYARCIRENGYPEWPDPNADGQFMLRRDQGMSMNDPRRQAAMEACQDLRPPGNYGAGPGGGMGQGFADEEERLAFAQCMRENGVPGFPDPSPGGGRVVIGPESGINPLDPKFQEALRTCSAAVPGAGQ